jgi:hypothetical protein
MASVHAPANMDRQMPTGGGHGEGLSGIRRQKFESVSNRIRYFVSSPATVDSGMKKNTR